VRFDDFFDLAEIQKIQDSFALATGVASIITTPSGVPLTRPSNFTRLCMGIIRATDKGLCNCMRSDAVLGAHNPGGPTIRRCMSGGLWDAGVSITVAGRHVANWLIGQVRSPAEADGAMLDYAREIGADPEDYRRALADVPVMGEERFRHVAEALFVMANSLSEKAYQQALLLQEKKERQERDAMREMLMDRSRDGIVIIDQEHRVVEANQRFAEMLGYSPDEVLGLFTWDYEAVLREAEIREVFGDFSSIEAVFESRHRRRDGTVFDVEVSVAGATVGDRSCVIAICRDISERKEAERLIRQGAEHFKALFELSQDGFILADAEGRYLDANAAYCRITGYTLPELRELGDFYAITPERWRDWQRNEIWPRLRETGDTGVYSKEYIHKDGHVFPVELRDFAVFDDDGSVRYAWGIVRDISERTRSEARISTLLQMIEQSPSCIVVTGTDGRIEYVNPKLVEVSGFAAEELKGLDVRCLGAREFPERGRELWNAVRSGRQWRGEFLNRRKDGSLYWVSALIAPLVDSQGRITHFVATMEDITQRRRAEEELRKSDVRFKKIVDILPQLVSCVGPDLRYRFVNAAFSRFFPSLDDPIGRSVPDVIGAKAFAASRPHIEQVLEGRPVHYSAPQTYPMAGERFMDVHLIPDSTEDGRVDGYYAILNDLSDLKKIEDSLRRAKDGAEAANKLKSEFLANMSHEIRTPLNGVLGMLRVLESTRLDAEQAECLRMAIKSSERLTRLLSDILDISKIEADRLVIRERPFDMEEVERALADLFSKAVEDRRVAYSFRRDPLLPPRMLGDDARLVQVLFNLVGNSLKFTDSGRVEVEVSPLPGPEGAPVRVLFTVRDTGRGIDPESLRTIFEPFIQVDGSYARRHQGVGLGLTIVRKLVRRMGGTVCLSSSPGEGTEVHVSLPFGLPDRCGSEGADRPELAAVLRGLRVLMVEDDEVNLHCGRRLLENAGYEVSVARDGREALEALTEGDFDLVLMDIQMPVLDGLETTRMIRTAEPFARFADIPVIALTAHAMAGDREMFLAAGLDGYLSKPFDLRKVHEEIGRVLMAGGKTWAEVSPRGRARKRGEG
jgi:PAS domain S-box-containing protein